MNSWLNSNCIKYGTLKYVNTKCNVGWTIPGIHILYFQRTSINDLGSQGTYLFTTNAFVLQLYSTQIWNNKLAYQRYKLTEKKNFEKQMYFIFTRNETGALANES